jgi:hypothetical protein
MELWLALLALLGLIGLGLLAVRFGHDSRDRLLSVEEQQARLGVTWDGQPGAPARRPVLVAVRQRVRHRTAAGLYRLADWLYPEPGDTTRAA